MGSEIAGFLDKITAALAALVRAAATVEECSRAVAWSAIGGAFLHGALVTLLILILFQDRRCPRCRDKGDRSQ